MKNEIVIVIVNYNKSDMTFECVQTVLKSDYLNLFIIIIDNSSEDKEYRKLKGFLIDEPRVEILQPYRNLGYAGGVNYGIVNALKRKPDYLLIMNNDTSIEKSAIKELVMTAQQFQNKCIVSGKVYDFENTEILQYTGSYFSDKRYLKESYPGKNEIDIGQHDILVERDMLDDIFWLLPSQLIDEVGLYSNYFFMYSEQADYALRAKSKGYKLIYCPKAKLWHKGSLSTGGRGEPSPVATYWRSKSSIIFLFLHNKRRFFYIHVIKKIIRNITKFFLCFFKPKLRRNHYAALIGTVHGFFWIFNKEVDDGYNPFLD